MNNSTEYSLNTSILKTELVNELKILDLIKIQDQDYLSMIGGGFNNSNLIIIIIGIIIIIIGFILYWYNNWKSTNANVDSLMCDNSQCKFNIIYNVNQTDYSKIITIDKINKPTTSQITVYYEDSNPNIVRLNNYNYIGISLIILGILIFLISINFNNTIDNSSSGIDVYQKTKNINGINIVYSKD